MFGEYPDSKVMDLARSLGQPAEVAVLDIGAGTGRNTLPLAREGFRTDAVELAPALTEVLKQAVEAERLTVGVHLGSILDDSVALPEQHYKLIFLSEVVSHFRNSAQLRKVFEVAARSLRNDGCLLFNTFVAMDGYKPDDLAREISDVMWCHLFTRHELNEASTGLFRCVSDESALEYERAHYPQDKWPPTGWYESWCAGQDAFDLNPSKVPMELRWFMFQRL